MLRARTETSRVSRPSPTTLVVDIPDGAAPRDLPPTYNEAVGIQRNVEKSGDGIDGDGRGGGGGDDDFDGNDIHDDDDQPPRYSQLNLNIF